MNSRHTSDLARQNEGLEPIAIVGMAGRFPMARNVREFWARLYNGEDCISRLTPETLQAAGVDLTTLEDPNYVCAAPVLEDVEQFDAAFFGITPREAELMDPQQRIFLECCWEALEDAGYDPKNCGQEMGLFAGARTDTYLFNILTHPDLLHSVGTFHLGLGNDLAFLTTRVSHFLNLTGPAVSIHTACSTSLVAVHIACEALRHRQCAAALAGGVAVNIPHYVGYSYEEGSVQSPDGYCRTFDASARGTVFGSGAGVVLLKRLDDAIANHDSIYAIIRGSAINNDGSDKASFTAPSVRGQVKVIREALKVAQVDPDTISYVECHGTGTLLGDAIEVRALIKSFGNGVPSSCAIGSVKTNVGHLDAAAGMTGLIKTVLSLRHKTIPASLHYVKPNPQIKFEGTRFYVNTSTSDWLSPNGPRRAGVSAFGVGGTNAHVVLEEAPDLAMSSDDGELQILPLSARSSEALRRSCLSLADHLQEHRAEASLADIAFTLQEGRHSFGFRKALMCSTVDEAVTVLRQSSSEGADFENSPDIATPVTFLFPGQGAQYERMGKELYQKESIFRATIRECSDILAPLLGRDLVSVLYESSSMGDGEAEPDLTETWFAQPSLLAVEYSLAKLWMSWGIQPHTMLGHSLGEYTAAVLSDVMNIEDALRLVAIRGRLMQQTMRGAMLAVSRSGGEMTSGLPNGLEIAAFNAPDLCTVAGSPESIKVLESQLKAQGIACQPLRTSHAFHTSLVEPAIAPFLDELRRIRLNQPRIPFISCVTGTWIRPEEAQQPEYWIRQMRLPVQFDAGLTELLNGENKVLLDIGPRQMLRHLALRKSRSYESCRVVGAMPAAFNGGERRSALTALAELWEVGSPVNWAALRAHASRRVPLPTYPFERSRFWIAPAMSESHTRKDFADSNNSKTDKKDSDVSHWFWISSPRLAALPTEMQSDGRAWIVYCDSSGLGDQICKALEAANESVIVVRINSAFRCNSEIDYALDPLVPDHHQRLWNSLAASGIDIGTIVSLLGIDHIQKEEESLTSPLDMDKAEIANGDLYGMQAMLNGSETRPCRYVIVSGSLMDIERFDDIDPSMVGILALTRTLVDEYEHHTCRVIDVVPSEGYRDQRESAKRIVEEIRSSATDEIVAHRGPKRWTRGFEQIAIPSRCDPGNLGSEDGAYLIIGGLGGIGLLIAEYLAREKRTKLVLTSRTALPSRSTWNGVITSSQGGIEAHRIRSILSLEARGAEVDIMAVDIADDEQMKSVISSVKNRFGRILGIIHTAGSTSDPSAFRPWAKLKPEDFSVQLRAKLHGLEVLAKVIQNEDVPFVTMISSNSSIVGGIGFAAYAAGNCSMNAFAERMSKRQGRTRWSSISWDHWPGATPSELSPDLSSFYEGLTETQITLALEQKYRYAMTREQAELALSYVIDFPGSGHLIVSSGDFNKRLASVGLRSSGSDEFAEVTSVPCNPRVQRPHMRNIFVAPRNDVEQALAVIWADYLGIEEVGVHDDFFELGGHSLLATKLIAHIRNYFSVELPLSKLFEAPTIAQMAEAVAAVSEA